MAIYMKYNDGQIKGDVTADGYQDWIELNSFQWGVGRGISMATGATADREASHPSVSEITVSKTQDKATVDLLTEALQGEGVTVEIDFTKTNQGKIEKFMTYNLTNCMISGYSISTGGDRPSKSLSLSFTAIECLPVIMGSDGTPASDAPKVKYDITQAKIV